MLRLAVKNGDLDGVKEFVEKTKVDPAKLKDANSRIGLFRG